MKNKKKIFKVAFWTALVAVVLVYAFTLHENRKMQSFILDTSDVGGLPLDSELQFEKNSQDITGCLQYEVTVNAGSYCLQLFGDNEELLYEVTVQECEWKSESIDIGKLTSNTYTIVENALAGEDGKSYVSSEGSLIANTYGYCKIMQWAKKFADFLGITDYKSR